MDIDLVPCFVFRGDKWPEAYRPNPVPGKVLTDTTIYILNNYLLFVMFYILLYSQNFSLCQNH